VTPLQSIIITGASSGIGTALAYRLAGAGKNIALLGRNAERLATVADACRRNGATCQTVALDLRDAEAVATFVDAFDKATPVDLLIANAGILDGRRADQAVEDPTVARRVFETNLLATIDIVHHVLPGMRARRNGTIVLVASLASFVPLPDAPAYSASKAALLSYGVALRDAVAADGVRVVVACPGFVATAMADHHIGPRPGEVTADAAADTILRGIRANRAVIGFPLVPYWLSRLTLLGPEWMRRRGMRGTRFHVGP
jgi:short-subunit dehydrogenase